MPFTQCSGPPSTPASKCPAAGTFELVESESGLLYRAEHDDATNPLNPAHWDSRDDAFGTPILRPTLLSGQYLVLSTLGLDEVEIATLNQVSARSEAMIYIHMKHGDAGDPVVENSLLAGPVLLATADPSHHPNDTDFVQGRYRMQEDVSIDNERLLMQETVGAASIVGNQRLLPGLHRETAPQDAYWMSFWAKDNGDYAMWDEFAASLDPSTFERTGVHGRTSGLMGLGVTGSSEVQATPQLHTDRQFGVKGRYVTINGAPAGYSGEVLTVGGTVIASGSEVGGVILIDMVNLGIGVSPKDVVSVRLKDDGGSVVHTLSPALGVWGGSVFTVNSIGVSIWSACTGAPAASPVACSGPPNTPATACSGPPGTSWSAC